MAKKAKTKTSRSTSAVYFQPGQHLGATHTTLIATDTNGKVWRFDMETGEARPVVFKN